MATDARGFARSSRPLRLRASVKKTKPRSSAAFKRTKRTDGLPAAPAVASAIASGRGTRARSASSNQRRKRTSGSVGMRAHSTDRGSGGEEATGLAMAARLWSERHEGARHRCRRSRARAARRLAALHRPGLSSARDPRAPRRRRTRRARDRRPAGSPDDPGDARRLRRHGKDDRRAGPGVPRRTLRRERARGAFLLPFTLSGLAHGHPAHDPLWAEAQDLDVPIAIHTGVDPPARSLHHRFTGLRWPEDVPAGIWYLELLFPQAVQQAFSTFFLFGTFDRFPRLKLVVLESGASWLGFWVDRMDALARGPLRVTLPFSELPSTYVRPQCWISGDPDERALPPIIAYVGDDRFLWAT